MATWPTICKTGDKVVLEWAQREMAIGLPERAGTGSMVLRQDGRILVLDRWSKRGELLYTLPLHKDGQYRIGPSYGHRVKTAAEETDPVARLLRERGVSVQRLHRMQHGQDLVSETFTCDFWRARKPGTTTNNFNHDGQIVEEEVLEEKSWANVNQYAGPDVKRRVVIRGATYAIEYGYVVHLNGPSSTPRIFSVRVWPECDPVQLAAAMSKFAPVEA